MKREANFQSTTFGKYVVAKGMFGNFELKQTTEDSIDFNDDRLKRQCDSLLAAQEKGYFWKHSDADQREKPFDCSNVPPVTGYLVIKYPDFFCFIEIDVFMKESQDSKRRSLTSKRAKEIACQIVR